MSLRWKNARRNSSDEEDEGDGLGEVLEELREVSFVDLRSPRFSSPSVRAKRVSESERK